MTWLFTGFAPFGGESVNSSSVLAQSLSRKTGTDCLILPESYEMAFQALLPRLESGRYQGVILLGQAAGLAKLSFERVAVNLENSNQPDSDGQIRSGAEIEAGGPHAVMNYLPLREIVQDLRSRIGPVEISTATETAVGNSLYYKAFRWCEKNASRAPRLLFLRLPYLPEQMYGKDGSMPFMSLSVLEQALSETLKALRGRYQTEKKGLTL